MSHRLSDFLQNVTGDFLFSAVTYRREQFDTM
jgi:hypothetical protein